MYICTHSYACTHTFFVVDLNSFRLWEARISYPSKIIKLWTCYNVRALSGDLKENLILVPPPHLYHLKVAQIVKNLPAMQETQVWSLGQEDPLQKGIVTHSSILAWRIPWTEEPARLQSMGTQGVHWLRDFTFTCWEKKCISLKGEFHESKAKKASVRNHKC